MPSFHGLSYISSCKFYCIPSHSWLGSFTSRTRPAAISSSASFSAVRNQELETYLSAPLIFFCRYNFVCLSFARLNNNSLIIGHGQVLLEYKMGSLIISAKEAAIINTSNSPNCPIRLGVRIKYNFMCSQKLHRKSVNSRPLIPDNITISTNTLYAAITKLHNLSTVFFAEHTYQLIVRQLLDSTEHLPRDMLHRGHRTSPHDMKDAVLPLSLIRWHESKQVEIRPTDTALSLFPVALLEL